MTTFRTACHALLAPAFLFACASPARSVRPVWRIEGTGSKMGCLVHARSLEVPSALATKLLGRDVRSEPIVDQVDRGVASELLGMPEPAAGGEPLFFVGADQRVVLSHLEELVYVKDFAVVDGAAEPVVGVVEEGVEVLVSKVSGEGVDRGLEIEVRSAEVQRPLPAFTTTLAGTSSSVTFELPEVRAVQTSRTLRLPLEGWIVVAAPSPRPPGSLAPYADRFVLILLEVTEKERPEPSWLAAE